MGIPSINAEEVGATGLIWLLLSYGYVLFSASNLISEGSDLLLLVPSLAGLVGSVVLPLLGAVPDGAIMLFSGLGDVEKAQETLSVGVGALAGSTIMLLTVPWGLCVLKGRVQFGRIDNEPDYKAKDTSASTLSTSGVALSSAINHGARVMMITTLPYFLIQVPAFFVTGSDRATVSSQEHIWALCGFLLCSTFFIGYMFTQIKDSNDEAHKLKRMAVIKESLKKGAMSLRGALASEVTRSSLNGDVANGGMNETSTLKGGTGTLTPEVTTMLKGVLGEAFKNYDLNKSGFLTKDELGLVLADFHEAVPAHELDDVFNDIDKDGNGKICFDEFILACYNIITGKFDDAPAVGDTPGKNRRASVKHIVAGNMLNEGEDDGEEEEEIPEEFTSLSPDEQQSAIKRKAFAMLFVGTALVLLFSDPMVEVLSEVAKRANIPAFYVSFILAPLASNASEVIASQYYAAKKTRKTITVALTALEGAASMNNSFCLAIFMALIYFRGLAWQFSAETISIVLVQFVIGTLALKGHMTAFTGMMVLAMFPLSVVFVATLEFFGMD
jgi:Ca2+/Na+ antiporter